MSYDLLIKNGTIIDGSGAASYQGDIAVKDDRIVGVGEVDADKASRTIDAEGKLVTPGFVDIHTHLDAQITWDPIASSSCWHGVTSVVMGNCGVTFAPCKPGDREYLAKLMESVEDIPARSIAEGMPWSWEHYSEYLTALDGIDIASVGPDVERHFLPTGINVHVVVPTEAGIRMLIWERGAGVTAACGSGACAATAIAALRRPEQSSFRVEMPGGVVTVRVGDELTLVGPSTYVAAIEPEGH